MENLELLLSQFGLAPIEIKLYLKLLERGQSTVLELSKQTKINRTTTHINVEKLIQKGLATHLKKGTKRVVIVEPPEKLTTLLEQEELRLMDRKNKLPKLISRIGEIYSINNYEEALLPSVRYYEGKTNVDYVYGELLKAKEIRGCTDIRGFERIYPGNLFEYSEKAKRGENRIWNIALDNAAARDFFSKIPKSKNHLYKYLPPDTKLPLIDCVLFDGNIAVTDFQDKPTSILIKSKPLYDSLKAMYDLLWERL